MDLVLRIVCRIALDKAPGFSMKRGKKRFSGEETTQVHAGKMSLAGKMKNQTRLFSLEQISHSLNKDRKVNQESIM